MEKVVDPIIVSETINNETRYIIIDDKTGDVIDNANGFGFKSVDTANNKIWYLFGGGKEKIAIKDIEHKKFCENNYLLCKKVLDLDIIVREIIKYNKRNDINFKDAYYYSTTHLLQELYSEYINSELYNYIMKNKKDIISRVINNPENSSMPICLYNKKSNDADDLAKELIDLFDIKARKGSYNKKDEFWKDFKTKSGKCIGQDVEKLIKKAKEFIKKHSNKK